MRRIIKSKEKEEKNLLEQLDSKTDRSIDRFKHWGNDGGGRVEVESLVPRQVASKRPESNRTSKRNKNKKKDETSQKRLEE
jgi:hypothetical protein